MSGEIATTIIILVLVILIIILLTWILYRRKMQSTVKKQTKPKNRQRTRDITRVTHGTVFDIEAIPDMISAIVVMGLRRALIDGELRIDDNNEFILEEDDAGPEPRNRLEQIDQRLTERYTSDPQNVHDSRVNNDMRGILRKLRADNPDPNSLTALAEAREFTEGAYRANPLNTLVKSVHALEILTLISEGHYIHTYGEREDHIFALVWERARLPENAAVQTKMYEAIIDGLADSMEAGQPVCVNGRATRIIGALTSLDYDPQMSNLHTSEMYKNEIYNRIKILLEDEIIRAARSDDPDLKDLASSFVNPEIEVDPDVDRTFRMNIYKNIREIVGEYSKAFTPKELEKIIADCCEVV